MSFHLVGEKQPYMMCYVPGILRKFSKVFFLDLDWTILHPTKSFNSGILDYHLLPDRSSKISELSKEYEIVIVTSETRKPVTFIQTKITHLFDLLTSEIGERFECIALCALDDRIKKPSTWMFDYYKKIINPNVSISESFMCGDAAGRKYTSMKDGIVYNIDYSDDDLSFAKNVGLKFNIPEEVFIVRDIPFSTKQEIVVMMGMPGSDRSLISDEIFGKQRGYMIVKQDVFKTFKKCLSMTDNYIRGGFSVIIDNTNPKRETRESYISITRKYNIGVRLIYSAEDGEIRNSQRSNPVPRIAYNVYFSNLIYPSVEEGYDELIIHWAKRSDTSLTELRIRTEEEFVPPRHISVIKRIVKIKVIPK